MNRAVGQWAPWISDPDPPEEPMTPEQSKAAAKATKDLVPQGPTSGRTEEELSRMRLELIEELLRDHPGMSRDEATARIDAFF